MNEKSIGMLFVGNWNTQTLVTVAVGAALNLLILAEQQ